jgi:hypothetical protein
MPLDADTLAWLDRVALTPGLLDNDTCTTVAREILAELGSGPEEALTHQEAMTRLHDWARAEDGLYNLTMSGTSTRNLQHGLVLLKKGQNLLLLQGWVGSFTLGQWLDGRIAGDGDACFQTYSPRWAEQGTPNMRTWLRVLQDLPAIFASGPDAFAAACLVLFGATLSHMERMNVRPDYWITLDWKFRRLQDY